ncbi:hypothetical protein MASR2M16_28530 [Thauera terpenica]
MQAWQPMHLRTSISIAHCCLPVLAMAGVGAIAAAAVSAGAVRRKARREVETEESEQDFMTGLQGPLALLSL